MSNFRDRENNQINIGDLVAYGDYNSYNGGWIGEVVGFTMLQIRIKPMNKTYYHYPDIIFRKPDKVVVINKYI